MPMHIHFILTMCLCSWQNSDDFPILSPQGGNSYAIQKECAILPLPVNLSHVILQHVELLLSDCNSFKKKTHTSNPLYVVVQCDLSLMCFYDAPKALFDVYLDFVQ